MAENRNVTMQGVQIIFRNFQGKEGKYNKPGQRNFGVLLDPQVAEDLIADEWNVKFLNPRDEEEEQNPQAWLPVEARYDGGRPPKIVLITGKGTRKRNLEEDEVEDIDWLAPSQILNVDMIVRGSHWEHSGRSGVKAYLQSMYIEIEEDELEQKYADLETVR
jgi:hypothetical protein